MAAKKKRKTHRKWSATQKKMREHYKNYFKNYTPLDEFYPQMRTEAARMGVFPPKRK
jgi:hypothetical protein